MCVQYPSILGGSGLGALVDRRHDSMDPMETIRVKWLPTALLWRFQSKAFWESNPPPNGQHGFIFPSAFTGEQFYAPEFLLRQYTEVEVNPDAELTAPLHDAARKWHEQIRLWATGRPWYNGENLTRWKQVCENMLLFPLDMWFRHLLRRMRLAPEKPLHLSYEELTVGSRHHGVTQKCVSISRHISWRIKHTTKSSVQM